MAARVYPSLVPVSNYSLQASADNQRAWQVFERWTKPFVCCFSGGDPITEGLDREFLDRVPGTGGQPHTPLRGGHFVQEDSGPGFARVVIQACRLDAFRHEPPVAASARVAVLAA